MYKNKPAFYVNFEKNNQTNMNHDAFNSATFMDILKAHGREFTDKNLCSKPNIDSYKLSRISDKYYKLSGDNLQVYNETIDLTDQGIFPNLYIKEISKEMGYGVFASKTIKTNTLLMRYAGEIKCYGEICAEIERSELKNNDLMILFPTKKEYYDRIIDPGKYCNMARYLNHSNSKSRNVATVAIINSQDKLEILLYAIKYKKKDAELLYNYDADKEFFWNCKN